MDKRLSKLLKSEIKKEESIIEFNLDNNYISKEVLKLKQYNLNKLYLKEEENIKYDNYYKIENLCKEYLTKIFKYHYSNIRYQNKNIILNLLIDLFSSKENILTIGTINKIRPNIFEYKITNENELIDYEELRKYASEIKPSMIIVSLENYPRMIDYKKIKEISNELNSILIIDISFLAALISCGIQNIPYPYADIVLFETNKTLRGPKGIAILTDNEDYIDIIDHNSVIDNKDNEIMLTIPLICESLYELNPDNEEQLIKVSKNAKIMNSILQLSKIKVKTDGTDTDLIVINTYNNFGKHASEAKEILEQINISVKDNLDEILISMYPMTSRNIKEEDIIILTNIIIKALKTTNNKELEELKEEVIKISNKYPID